VEGGSVGYNCVLTYVSHVHIHSGWLHIVFDKQIILNKSIMFFKKIFRNKYVRIWKEWVRRGDGMIFNITE